MDMLANTCYFIIGFCIIMYVLLDGFDLGIGILFPLFNDKEKDILLSTILPVWDGNQTWLVLGIAVFYGAFPQAFSLMLPALYLPLLIMVIALLMRGITFEFRLKEKQYRWAWDRVFFVSSLVITFSQGILLGSFVSGFDIVNDQLVNSLLTPFNLFCGFALLFGYSLLACTWAAAKTEAKLQKHLLVITKYLLWGVSFALLVISAWSPYVNPAIWNKWFGVNFYKVLLLPCATAAVVVYFHYALTHKLVGRLYALAVMMFICAYIGFGISTWPYIIPHQVTLWQAAAPASTQAFMLIGALLLLPILVIYTSYAYYIFRGKVKDVIGYD